MTVTMTRICRVQAVTDSLAHYGIAVQVNNVQKVNLLDNI